MTSPLIELRVPGEPSSVAVVRSSVASLAARLDFTLDRLEDLRLATNEACALLLALAGPPTATLAAVVEEHGTGLRVDLSREGAASALPQRDDFAWLVLRALVDELDVREDAGRVHLVLTSGGGAAA